MGTRSVSRNSGYRHIEGCCTEPEKVIPRAITKDVARGWYRKTLGVETVCVGTFHKLAGANTIRAAPDTNIGRIACRVI